ncbi:NAD(P)H-dependent flavin oxidoreductase [Nocardioides alcanivorans]|uniref:NAD(P)H-dependent flavin oxidoreductase n=1 Tax=Nocardioides alcanivorans TaxID=2897352 RepID=UPI001F298D0D|nr:nitronate monooxygenase [Nocardioides alcanivorans]
MNSTSPRESRTRFEEITGGLAAPMIAAPMTGVSSFSLVDAVTRAGVAGSFPVHNCTSPQEVDRWLTSLAAREASELGPVIPNLVVHRTNKRQPEDLRVMVEHRVPAVITSVGSPAHVVPVLHGAGIQVWSDVASMKHVRRAIDAGVDALVLLTAGAGGQTGWANPFPFIRAVRQLWDGPVILAGGVCDGTSLLAAQVAGCDLGYVGTPFIATLESGASDAYRSAVAAADIDDIELTSDLTGLATSMIRSSSARPQRTEAAYDAAVVTEHGGDVIGEAGLFSAGHTVAGIHQVTPAADLVARFSDEYRRARAAATL